MRDALPLLLTAGLLACPSAPAECIGSAVTLELRTDQAGPLTLYPVSAPSGSWKAYAEAVRGASYRITVHNNLGCRVGVVLAVDGRNIISGAKSWLRSDERMYILGPGETQEYAGWRTAQDKVNRFYFTTMEDSYAAAFGDTSAMGVVAMAVFPEAFVYPRPTARPGIKGDPGWDGDVPMPRPPSRPGVKGIPGLDGAEGAAEMAPKSAPAPGVRMDSMARSHAGSPPGTGYGEEVYSPSITVAFEPESRPREKSFIKYEWRETLVRLGVLRTPEVPRNRLWDSGFAPPPPRL